MKIIESKRKNGSIRVQMDFSDEKCITDQAPAAELTMASIVKKLEKGIMPNMRSGLVYSTDLGIRNLQDVHDRQQQTMELFYQLPTEIRSLMQNDVKNFESVIFDPNNAPLLQKYDLLVQRNKDHSELIHAIESLKPHLNTPEKTQKQPE